jgi:hypothetical protein
VAIIQGQVANWAEQGREAVQLAGYPSIRIRATFQAGGQSCYGEFYPLVTAQHQLLFRVVCLSSQAAQRQATLKALADSFRAAGAGPAVPPVMPPVTPPYTPPVATPVTPPPAPGVPEPPAMKTVRSPQGTYSITVPADWTVEQQGDSFAATSPQQNAQVRCFAGPKTVQTLEQLGTLLATSEQRSVPGWAAQGSRNFQAAGRPALLVQAAATINGTPCQIVYVLVLTDTHQANLIFLCPAQLAAQYQAAFGQVLQSFQMGAPPRAATPDPFAPAPQPPAPGPGPQPPAPPGDDEFLR